MSVTERNSRDERDIERERETGREGEQGVSDCLEKCRIESIEESVYSHTNDVTGNRVLYGQLAINEIKSVKMI